jgi:hypothetical protein
MGNRRNWQHRRMVEATRAADKANVATLERPEMSGWWSAHDKCWCGRESGHTWPGKDLGAAHPR